MAGRFGHPLSYYSYVGGLINEVLSVARGLVSSMFLAFGE